MTPAPSRAAFRRPGRDADLHIPAPEREAAAAATRVSGSQRGSAGRLTAHYARRAEKLVTLNNASLEREIKPGKHISLSFEQLMTLDL